MAAYARANGERTGRVAMDGDWLTYREAAERLGSTAEAVRYRALRGQMAVGGRGNDGRARVQISNDAHPVPTSSAHPVRTPSEPRSDPALPHALVETLKGQIANLQAHIETLKGQIAAAEARDVQHVADLVAERAKTEKAIAAFASLAERLDALAAERARPWWRRWRTGKVAGRPFRGSPVYMGARPKLEGTPYGPCSPADDGLRHASRHRSREGCRPRRRCWPIGLEALGEGLYALPDGGFLHRHDRSTDLRDGVRSILLYKSARHHFLVV